METVGNDTMIKIPAHGIYEVMYLIQTMGVHASKRTVQELKGYPICWR